MADDDSDDALELEDNDDGGLQLEDNDDDEGLTLEDNGEDDGEDGLKLEDNDEDGLVLEDNDDGELQLEDNDDSDGLALEDNDEEDGLELEANDEDCLTLEENGKAEHTVEHITTEPNGFFLGGQGAYGQNGSAGIGGYVHVGSSGGQTGGSGYNAGAQSGLYGQAGGIAHGAKAGAYGGAYGTAGGFEVYGSGGNGQRAHGMDGGGQANAGIVEALNALNAGNQSLAHGGGGIDPFSYLIPQAKALLDEALAAAPDHVGGQHAKLLDTIQKLTANNDLQSFLDGCDQIVAKEGADHIADRMRQVGDDHFAAGCHMTAHHAYSAGLTKGASCSAAERMTLHVNRAAARIKLQMWEEAVEDCSEALELEAETPTVGGKVQRNALLRRAKALAECGEKEDARADLGRIGKDSAADQLREKYNL